MASALTGGALLHPLPEGLQALRQGLTDTSGTILPIPFCRHVRLSGLSRH